MHVKEEYLALIPMMGRTRGEDILKEVLDFFEKQRLPNSKLFSICTDGCPAMTGKEIGFATLLRNAINPDLLALHCILHLEALSAKIKSTTLLEVIQSVIKLVNHIRANKLLHRQFQDFLKSCDDAKFKEVPFHTEVRWLSLAAVLERVVQLRPKIVEFFGANKKDCEAFPEVDDPRWIQNVSFLADFTAHLAALNKLLQGDNKSLSTMVGHVTAFQEKLVLFREQLVNGDTIQFRHLRSVTGAADLSVTLRIEYGDCIEMAQKQFDDRFGSCIARLKLIGLFLGKPRSLTMDQVSEIATICNVDLAGLQSNIIDFKHLEDDSDVELFNFPVLRLATAKALSIFVTTYRCEQSFSAMKQIKNDHRTRLTNDNLDALMRCSQATASPNIKQVMGGAMKQFQQSH
jgi:hypothetical protein